MLRGGKYDARRVRSLSAPYNYAADFALRPRPALGLAAALLAALALSACGGSKGVSDEIAAEYQDGAQIFSERCGGCHTMAIAGTQGSGNRSLRAQGPNLDGRVTTADDALRAIQNGGFSGAIMPQNIVVGEDAEKVAAFIGEYSGGAVEEPARPAPEPIEIEPEATTSSSE